jgi:hypothetical protein
VVAALIRSRSGVRIEWISPDGSREEVARFDRKTFYDVTDMVLSPDGLRAAVEVHKQRAD